MAGSRRAFLLSAAAATFSAGASHTGFDPIVTLLKTCPAVSVMLRSGVLEA